MIRRLKRWLPTGILGIDSQMDISALTQELQQHGQGHLLDHWDTLTDDEKKHLYQDLKSIDFAKVCRVFDESTKTNDSSLDEKCLEALTDDVLEGVIKCSPQQLETYRKVGLEKIAQGKVASLLLAGGQGTRLGVKYPKGMYDVELPSHKTLFQIQAERLHKLTEIAQALSGRECSIPWYIMTSERTMEPTETFFEEHGYFGLNKNDVFIFEQGTLPCFDMEGKILLETPSRVARAPDGNGGLYFALREGKVLQDMESRGIEYIHVYCVDNILVKMADPTFIGYCVTKGAEAGAKVVEKTSPTEAVGNICRVNGVYQVVEYSEITPEIAEARNEDGKLKFNAGSICNHFFTLRFLERLCSDSVELKHHVARKKIPYVNKNKQIVHPTEPNGLKLEKFVFDVFCYTQKFVVWEVLREEEFSPLKNAEGAKKDTPSTARQALYSLHRSFIEKAGGKIDTSSNDESEVVVEISPLISYDGEGLNRLVSGKSFKCPVVLSELHSVPDSITLIPNGNH